jgi:hypothetical protein
VVINAVPGAPTATLAAVDPTCAVPTGTITVTSSTTGLQFAVDGGAYASYPSGGFSGLATGAHTIKVKNAAGCETTLNQAIGAAPTPPVAPTVTPTSPTTCAQSTGTITVTAPVPGAGISYSIDGTTYTNTTGVFNNVSPGNYNVTVKNAAGCISSPKAVTIAAAPSAPAAPTATPTQPTCSTPTGTITVTVPERLIPIQRECLAGLQPTLTR